MPVSAWDQHVTTADQHSQEPVGQLMLVEVVEVNGSAHSSVSARTTKAAANQEDIVLVQAAGAVKTTTKVVKIGGHGDSNMDRHGDLRSDHRAVTNCLDLIPNTIPGMTYTTCKVLVLQEGT